MTQDVQVPRPTPMKTDFAYTPGRRKANQIFKMAVHNLEERGRPEAKKLDVDIGLVYSLGPKFPEYRLISPETDEIIIQLMQHLDQRIQKRATLLDDFNARGAFKRLPHIYFNLSFFIDQFFFSRSKCRKPISYAVGSHRTGNFDIP